MWQAFGLEAIHVCRSLSSPEVTEEALQVVGVAQFVLALVGTSHEAAPRRVQLSAFLLNIIHSLRMGLDQTLSCLTQRVHLPQDIYHRTSFMSLNEKGLHILIYKIITFLVL